jgi:hypothetical protein
MGDAEVARGVASGDANDDRPAAAGAVRAAAGIVTGYDGPAAANGSTAQSKGLRPPGETRSSCGVNAAAPAKALDPSLWQPAAMGAADMGSAAKNLESQPSQFRITLPDHRQRGKQASMTERCSRSRLIEE